MENNKKLELVIPTKDLVYALNFASAIVEKRNIMMELSHIKLCAKNGFLEIGATDMDLYLNQEIGAEVISEGEITVSSQTLADIIRKIPDSTVRIKQSPEHQQLEIIGANCRFDLPALPATQFPQMENIESDISFAVPCQDFVRLIECTNFAMSSEESRYNLNGIYLHIKDNNQFCASATDGHRLSVATCNIENTVFDFGVIVPKKAMHEILKIIKDTRNISGDINISLATNKIKFSCGKIIMISKLIDGTFPEYSSFIPLNNQNKLTINPKLLADAIDRVATVTIDKFRAIKIVINEKSIQITASGEAKGVAQEQLSFSDDENAYCKFSGSEITIGFNPKYLTDVFSALKEKKIELYLNDSFSPILIKAENFPNDNFVIMPVKV